MSLARLSSAIRPGERRDTWAAFTMLFGFVGGLAILETARDALFLTKMPATRLPWMYLSIAAISLGIVSAQSRWMLLAGRRLLSAWTLVTAGVTFLLARSLDRLGASGIYGVYIWTSVLGTLVLVHLWTLLANVFTVTQAKRLYGLIGTGSVLGAIAGSGAARSLLRAHSPRYLLWVAGGAFLCTALVPPWFTRGAPRGTEAGAPPRTSTADSARFVARHAYARRVVLAMSLATAGVTLGDYVFKSTAAAVIPKAELGTWLATVYLVLNVASLFAQIALTGWITRRFSVTTAFAVLPALLLAGGIGMVLSGGIAAALLIKAADGGLRYSLHKTSSEMLFLAFTDAARQRVKAFIDVVGQRGGQTIASIAILLLARTSLPHALAFALVALAAAWLGVAIALRAPYLDLFRGRLPSGHLERHAFPELDLASLETLIGRARRT